MLKYIKSREDTDVRALSLILSLQSYVFSFIHCAYNKFYKLKIYDFYFFPIGVSPGSVCGLQTAMSIKRFFNLIYTYQLATSDVILTETIYKEEMAQTEN